MDPLFFGRPDRQLFGAYHPPESERARGTGVVLCYPAVPEYQRTHFAFRKLAALLAREGFHVLRFDYAGTGDSAGDLGTATVAEWCEDVGEAVAELKDLAGVRRVSIVGMRLGAVLAAAAVNGGIAVRDLVLWEPVIRGADHLEELRSVNARKLAKFQIPVRAAPDEVLGYVMSPVLRSELEQLDLAELGARNAGRALLFVGELRPEYAVVGERLRDRQGRPAQVHVVPDEAASRGEGVMLSTRILQAMAAALGEDT